MIKCYWVIRNEDLELAHGMDLEEKLKKVKVFVMVPLGENFHSYPNVDYK